VADASDRLELFENGSDYFRALERAIGRAAQSVFLETYIFEDDAVGKRIVEALKKASQSGVDVRVLIDGFGSKDLPLQRIDELRRAGVRILKFRPQFSPFSFRRKHLRRLHRKIVVIDSRVAFVGGMNIISDLDEKTGKSIRLDFTVSVEGPLVKAIRHSAQRLWARVSHTKKVRASSSTASDSVSLVVRDNFLHRRDIERAYLRAIRSAKSEILIANAYFLPGYRFRRALKTAARRGVRVTLLLQGRDEYFLLRHASQTLYGSFLRSGVEIYEYTDGFLHAKVAVVDGQWATVGSSNIDPFSLFLALEANVVIRDKKFAKTLQTSLKKIIETGTKHIAKNSWRKQPVTTRFLGRLSYSLIRLFVGFAGYANEYGRF
jgi:cardiolipin synthase